MEVHHVGHVGGQHHLRRDGQVLGTRRSTGLVEPDLVCTGGLYGDASGDGIPSLPEQNRSVEVASGRVKALVMRLRAISVPAIGSYPDSVGLLPFRSVLSFVSMRCSSTRTDVVPLKKANTSDKDLCPSEPIAAPLMVFSRCSVVSSPVSLSSSSMTALVPSRPPAVSERLKFHGLLGSGLEIV